MDDNDPNFMHSKKKRKRTAPDQLKVLEDVFNGHQHPNLLMRNQLAVQLGMTPRSVQIWFQNRRAKARNMEFTTSSLASSVSALTGAPISPRSPTQSPTTPTNSIEAKTTIEESIYKSIYLSSFTSKAQFNEDEHEEVHTFWLKYLQSQYPHLSYDFSHNRDQNEKKDSTTNASPTNSSPTSDTKDSLADPPTSSKFDINARDSKGLSLLFISSVLGYEPQTKKLVESGADVNIIDNAGNSALSAASLLGHTAIVSYLLSKGADCNLGNGEGYTPLYLACKSGYSEIVVLLLDAGAEMDIRTEEEGDTALHVACLKGHVEICKTLLQRGAKVSVSDKNRLTPLHHACVKGHLKVVSQLVRVSNIDVNAKGTKGHTALHTAALMGFDQVVACLIENKSDIDSQDAEGYTPLLYAVREGREEVVKQLIRAGADLNIKSNTKLGIIHIAARWSSVKMCSLLIDSGRCNTIDDENVNGLRPLHFAALTGKSNLMRYLIDKGAKPSVNDLDLSSEELSKLPDCASLGPYHATSTSTDSHEQSAVDVKQEK